MADIRFLCLNRRAVEQFVGRLCAAGIVCRVDTIDGQMFVIVRGEDNEAAAALFEEVTRPTYGEWRAMVLYEMALRDETRGELADAIGRSVKTVTQNLSGRQLSRRVLDQVSKHYDITPPPLPKGTAQKSREVRIW